MPDCQLILATDDWRCQTIVEPGSAICGADSDYALIRFHLPYSAHPVCDVHLVSTGRSYDRPVGRQECREVQETMIAMNVMKHHAGRVVDAAGRTWAPTPDWTAKPYRRSRR